MAVTAFRPWRHLVRLLVGLVALGPALAIACPDGCAAFPGARPACHGVAEVLPDGPDQCRSCIAVHEIRHPGPRSGLALASSVAAALPRVATMKLGVPASSAGDREECGIGGAFGSEVPVYLATRSLLL